MSNTHHGLQAWQVVKCAGAYNWYDELAASWWLAQPLQDGEPRQWGASLSAFPNPSGHGWSIAVGRSAGGAFPTCSRSGLMFDCNPL